MTPETTAMMIRTVDGKKAYRNQILAALAVSIGTLAGGMGKGYSSPAIASLQAVTNSSGVSGQPFTVTDQEASWVASLSLLGALLGGIFGGAFMKMGRQRVLVYISIPFGMSWLFTAFASSVALLYATSISAGFFTAIVTMVTQVYISESTVSSARGRLSSVSKIFNQFGVLLSFLIGALVNWQVHAAIIACVPLILLCCVLKLPETPSYLLLNRKDDKAKESLQWLRGPETDIQQELATIRGNIFHVTQMKTNPASDSICAKLSVHGRLVKPVLITCGLMLFQRFTGAYAFNFYAVSIFKKSLGAMNPHFGAIIMSLVQTLASCLSGLLIDKIGRLPLLKVSGILMSLALAGFGSYSYYLKSSNIDTGEYDWVPLLCVLIFTVAFSLGISPISWLLIGELFPLEYRSTGSSLASTFSYLCAFLNVKTFVDFQEQLGMHGTFWLYSGISLVGLLFVIFCVPETRGRSMDEMNPKYIESVCINR